MKESDLQKIDRDLAKIKTQSFYGVLTGIFSFLAGMHIFYWFYHKNSHNLYHVALGGMWLVVAVAIYKDGYMANYYKRIIKQLLLEIQHLKKNADF